MAWGELKRMIMDERARQQGIGRALLRTVEIVALGNGVGLIRTEVGGRGTSTHQPYRRAGYRDREPFGTHRPSSHSIFLEKQVSTAPPERACMDSKRLLESIHPSDTGGEFRRSAAAVIQMAAKRPKVALRANPSICHLCEQTANSQFATSVGWFDGQAPRAILKAW